ncbi:MAG: MCE family protein [Paludibacteraceae bacterium]|nr:MCE family protein [Paludibacteraceae bacterium]MBR4841159.1 MCE family protein [Paludibacteraceae bacterium]
MIKISKEFQIGALVVATVAILFFGVNYLKGVNVFNPTNYYYAKFERVNGLLESSSVTVQGVKLGVVKSINYNFDDVTDGVVVELSVDDELRVPVGSMAVLTCGLLGGADVSLSLKQTYPGQFYKPGDTIPAILDEGPMTAVTEQVMPRIQAIIPQLDSLIYSLRMITEDNSIQKTLGNINRMTANLERTSVSLDKMMSKDVPVILGNVNAITTDFSKVSSDLSRLDLVATMNKVDATLANLKQITDKVNSGNGTVGLLLNDRSLYDNLNNTAGSANNLLVDLKTNPRRYVHFSMFGKSDKKEKDKEKDKE